MTNFDDLLNGFKTQEEPTDLFPVKPTEQPKQTPEDRDLGRLEQDIHEIFGSRRFLNQVLVALLGVTGSTACIHLFARLGIPALASGTLGGIVIKRHNREFLGFSNCSCGISGVESVNITLPPSGESASTGDSMDKEDTAPSTCSGLTSK